MFSNWLAYVFFFGFVVFVCEICTNGGVCNTTERILGNSDTADDIYVLYKFFI